MSNSSSIPETIQIFDKLGQMSGIMGGSDRRTPGK